ncbi:magnesium chelatase [Bacteroidia bacterium]|nr:magnesium chelatase [Bacteroidia bacterium]
MLVKTFGSSLYGVRAITITIETSVDLGVNFMLVGLPDNAVKESQQRIESALSQNGYRLPGKKIIINMAPANLRKEGSAYDLPLAISILAASEQIKHTGIERYMMMGELSLDGSLRPIKGALPMALEALEKGFDGLILPKANADEAAIVMDLNVYGVDHILEVIRFFDKDVPIERVKVNVNEAFEHSVNHYPFDFSEVKGQHNIKRALEITAAGGHNVILIGPPGSGKTMLAQRMPSILPPMTLSEALETTKIHSVAGKLALHQGLITMRPFRSPHHTISDVALVGGGSSPQPGEISLAHNGVLFLDEMPEFKRPVLEVLRQPMEEHKVTISRSKMSIDYPTNFMLVAAMNPCPCGNYNHPSKECICAPGVVNKYLSKISGPLMDRIDLHVEVSPVAYQALHDTTSEESSAAIRNRVIAARNIQKERFINASDIHCNAQMTSHFINLHCQLDNACGELLKGAMEKLQLTARAYSRILKVARTIADLDGSDSILSVHIAEAIHFRSLDRETWGTH